MSLSSEQTEIGLNNELIQNSSKKLSLPSCGDIATSVTGRTIAILENAASSAPTLPVPWQEAGIAFTAAGIVGAEVITSVNAHSSRRVAAATEKTADANVLSSRVATYNALIADDKLELDKQIEATKVQEQVVSLPSPSSAPQQ